MVVQTAQDSLNAPTAGAGAAPASHDQQSIDALAALGLPQAALPRHIAIIMDGNGRWAKRQNKPRQFGHKQGAKSVRGIVTQCARLKIDYLTLYSFSSENWVRPTEEVDFLMDLYVEYLIAERETMMQNNVRFQQIGRREGLSPRILDQLDSTRAITAPNTGLTLVLALNYGSRSEIADAARAIARKVKAGELDPADINEQTVEAHLYTAGMPDPDLLIRTAGEMRISNYLLWQISYAEFYSAQVCWPDFSVKEFNKALHDFASRKRKFGNVDPAGAASPAPGISTPGE